MCQDASTRQTSLFQPVASGSSQFAALDHSLVFSDLPCARFCVLLAVSMDDETLACYVSSEEEAGQQPQRVKAQPGKAPSQLAPGWLNPSPGSQAGQKKQEKASSLDHDTAIVLRHSAHSSTSRHDDIHCISHGSGTGIGKGSRECCSGHKACCRHHPSRRNMLGTARCTT